MRLDSTRTQRVYDGVIDGNISVLHDFGDGLVVRREAAQPDGAEKDAEGGGKTPAAGGAATGLGKDGEKPVPPEPLPRRFFASIPIESERAGLEVARIMDGLLVELTRTKRSNIQLTLEIVGTAVEQGYPKDVVDTVKANARDLKLDQASYGFEED